MLYDTSRGVKEPRGKEHQMCGFHLVYEFAETALERALITAVGNAPSERR